MIAQVGDRIVVEGTHVGDRRRIGVITDIVDAGGAPPYQVRWLDSGQTSLFFPGAEAHIERPAAGTA